PRHGFKSGSASAFFDSVGDYAADGLKYFYGNFVSPTISAVVGALSPLIGYISGDLGVSTKVTTSAVEASATGRGTADNPQSGAQVIAGGASILTLTNQATAHVGNQASVNQDDSYRSPEQSVTVSARGDVYTINLAAMASLFGLPYGNPGTSA